MLAYNDEMRLLTGYKLANVDVDATNCINITEARFFRASDCDPDRYLM
jgi:hypothetical protein